MSYLVCQFLQLLFRVKYMRFFMLPSSFVTTVTDGTKHALNRENTKLSSYLALYLNKIDCLLLKNTSA